MHDTATPHHRLAGSKAGCGVYQTLINQMPPPTVYCESFLGHGAVMLHKRPAAVNIGVDLDHRAVGVVVAMLQHRHGERVCSTVVSDDGAVTDLMLGQTS